MAIAIHWFRQDLRLADNPALTAAAEHGEVLPIYILDTHHPKKSEHLGGASKVWLHASLKKLNDVLDGNLKFFEGDAVKIIKSLTEEIDVEAVFWNRCYEPWRIERDRKIKEKLSSKNIQAKSFNGSLLWEPWEVFKDNQDPYKVFTPFSKKAFTLSPREALKKPAKIKYFKDSKGSVSLEDLKLLTGHLWEEKTLSSWQVGEEAAYKKLKSFLKEKVQNYKVGRDFPAEDSISKLSPHLHLGEISPNQVWKETKKLSPTNNTEHFLRELAWREFSYHLLYYFPKLQRENFQPKFNFFPWKKNKKHLHTWQKGQTGYPIVDAGMRELWKTGYMHNRVRMIVGSFLVKNLLIHWHEGEKWFWDCLFDADLANNSASWQWVAGCGADAAPYFRIFNPILQAKKFDPDACYIKKYIPELAKLPTKYAFAPWEAPKEILEYANVELGTNYPKPIVELQASRDGALEAYEKVKGR